MVWRRMFHNDPAPDESSAGDPEKPKRQIPPHLAQRLDIQAGEPRDPEQELRRRLARLRNQHTATLYDIEQGELALEDDNPWKRRVALLTEALETVESDYREAEQIEPGPFHQLPETPVTDFAVEMNNDVATVRLTAGTELFEYEEPLDWAERGHQVTREELRRVAGDPSLVVPADVPPALRPELQAHLDQSLFVLATVLRDRTLDEEPLPKSVTMADLAKPCPTCGGWTDYRGRCQTCARRSARLQELFRERDRLLNERAAEIEEQHRIAERLPLARRRHADIERQIAETEARIGDQPR